MAPETLVVHSEGFGHSSILLAVDSWSQINFIAYKVGNFICIYKLVCNSSLCPARKRKGERNFDCSSRLFAPSHWRLTRIRLQCKQMRSILAIP